MGKKVVTLSAAKGPKLESASGPFIFLLLPTSLLAYPLTRLPTYNAGPLSFPSIARRTSGIGGPP